MRDGLETMDRRRDLDGLRGIAVLLTIFLHYIDRGGYLDGVVTGPLARFFGSFWSGVDIFFVLSGFLIGGIILDKGRAQNFFRVFYLRRSLRILPVALLAIGFSYLILPILAPVLWFQSSVPFYAYLLFANNFWTASGVDPYPPLGPMWSLAIEQQFYLVAPAFLLFVDRRARNAALLTLVGVSPFLRMHEFAYSSWDFTPMRLDGFSIGILVAVALRNERFCEFSSRNIRTINAVVALMVTAAVAFSICPGLLDRERIAYGISLNSLAAAGVVLYTYVNSGSQFSLALSRPWLLTLGKFSYFLYLMHMPILMYVKFCGVPDRLQAIVAFALCLLGGWVSWRFMESKLMNLGKHFQYAGSTPMHAVGSASAKLAQTAV